MYLPYLSADRQTVLGHYSTLQRSGEVVSTMAAAVHLARIRWAPGGNSTFCVLLRLKVGLSISGAVTDGRIEQAYQAVIARNFTVDFTTGKTFLNLATTNNGRSNAMRSSMSPSLMGAAGPGIVTTLAAGMTGQTMTVDASPFCGGPLFPPYVITQSVGTATLLPAGTQVPMATLYERTADGQHPVVLSNNEGVIVQNILAGYASGTIALYVQWEWAEVAIF